MLSLAVNNSVTMDTIARVSKNKKLITFMCLYTGVEEGSKFRGANQLTRKNICGKNEIL